MKDDAKCREFNKMRMEMCKDNKDDDDCKVEPEETDDEKKAMMAKKVAACKESPKLDGCEKLMAMMERRERFEKCTENCDELKKKVMDDDCEGKYDKDDECQKFRKERFDDMKKYCEENPKEEKCMMKKDDGKMREMMTRCKRAK